MRNFILGFISAFLVISGYINGTLLIGIFTAAFVCVLAKYVIPKMYYYILGIFGRRGRRF